MPKTPAPASSTGRRLLARSSPSFRLSLIAQTSLRWSASLAICELDVVPLGLGRRLMRRPTSRSPKTASRSTRPARSSSTTSGEPRTSLELCTDPEMADLVNSMIRQDQASADKMTDDLVKEFPEEEDPADHQAARQVAESPSGMASPLVGRPTRERCCVRQSHNIIYTDSPDAANQIVKWINSGNHLNFAIASITTAIACFTTTTRSPSSNFDRRDPMQEKQQSDLSLTQVPQ